MTREVGLAKGRRDGMGGEMKLGEAGAMEEAEGKGNAERWRGKARKRGP